MEGGWREERGNRETEGWGGSEAQGRGWEGRKQEYQEPEK